jgi:hypothetical protein
MLQAERRVGDRAPTEAEAAAESGEEKEPPWDAERADSPGSEGTIVFSEVRGEPAVESVPASGATRAPTEANAAVE